MNVTHNQAMPPLTGTSLFAQTINIDKGSSDGLRTGQPVMTGAGLVGKVSFVASSAGKVTLLTDSTFRASARTSGNVTGVIKPAAGNPDDLVMSGLAARDQVDKGDIVSTRGTDPQASDYPSLFPPGIPIGTVTGVDDPGTDTQQVGIRASWTSAAWTSWRSCAARSGAADVEPTDRRPHRPPLPAGPPPERPAGRGRLADHALRGQRRPVAAARRRASACCAAR